MIGIDWYAGRDGAVSVGDRVMVKRDLSAGRKNDGIWWTVETTAGVVAHVRAATVTDATVKVSAATQRRWAGKRKKPCAWIVGTLAADVAPADGARAVTFDFHSGRPEFFYADDTSATFTTAPVVTFTDAAYAAI